LVPLDLVESPPFRADDAPAPLHDSSTALSEPVLESVASTAAEPEAPLSHSFVPQEVIDAVREDKIAQNLEEDFIEVAELAGTMPSGEVRDTEAESSEYWDSPLPEVASDAAGAAAYLSEELELPAMAPEEDSDNVALESSEGEAGPPQEAAVRERPANPRYQRRQRWGARRQRGGGGEEQRRRTRTWERERETPKPLIGDMLKEGQEILVQIAKEPLGKKGARITSHIALPGRYVVFMPTLDHVGVSRKIESDEERHRLKRIIVEQTRGKSGGFIVRTAGEGHSEEDLKQDVQFLVNLWADIKAKAERASAPALLHHDLDLTLRTLRDQLSDEFQTIWVDNEQAYEQVVSLVQKFQPALVSRVRLFTKDVPLFEETGVQEEINKALKPKVWLKSGGYIVINQTEALVAIDVNTGKFVGKSNRLEDTIVKTNVEAIQEIVRQIRLRDLGGIIVIDFIDMDERRNRQKVMSELEAALRADKSPSKILAFNEFGLVAITRKRVRQSLERTLCQPCAYCSGAGLVKTPATVCLEILTEAKKMTSELEGKHVTLRVNPEVGKALKSRDSAVLTALEEITGRGVIIRSDAAVHIENFYFD
jgi:ribonuclease G